MDLDNFVCPYTKIPLTIQGLKLNGGNTSASIVNGIPRFVTSENYASAFGLQWNTFPKTQFDSFTGQPISEERLSSAFNEPLSELNQKRVLEAGSGAGRFTEVLLKYGAKVYSFDFSDAVDANGKNNLPNERLTLFQGDIRKIPFNDGFFDIVVCVGVLQHTPSTFESLKELTRVLRQGGTLICDHYKYHLGVFTSLYIPYWFLIRKLPPKLQLHVTNRLTDIFFPIHWYFRKSPSLQRILRRISPINFYFGQFNLPKNTLYEWSRLDTHDRNTDFYKHHVTKRRFEKFFHDLKYSTFKVSTGGTGYVCKAIK
ncbi:MAG: class I SAM-dependent methyltransferase [Planctomycetales bacterium]|nr:class I SAM-dependent methyltransferase [Planctomycetales bacterium]